MEFEDILEQVGGYGWYQKRLTLFFLVPVSCLLPCFFMNAIFMVSVPDHWCHVPELASSNLSVSQQRALISPPDDPSCSMYDRDYSVLATSPGLLDVEEPERVIPCKDGWQYDKEDFDFTASSQFDMVCDKRHFPSMILSLQNVGSLIGTPVYGFLSDRYGRRTVFLIIGVVVVVTELGAALTGNLIGFIVFRTLTGTVRPTMLIIAIVLISEIVCPKMRCHMNGILNICWTLGFCLLPLVACFSRNWVVLELFSAGVGATFLLQCLFIPESPCWLVSQGKYKQAADIMMEIAKVNGKNHTYPELLLDLEILGEKIERAKRAEKEETGSVLLKYPRLRRNFIILAACWAGFYLSYSGFTYNIVNLNGNQFVNFFLLAVVEVPATFLFWFLMDKAGRRWSASIGFFLMGIFSLIPLIDFPMSDLVGSAIGKLFISGIVMVTDQQANELFPTVTRSFCISTGKTVATLLSLLSPYLAYLSTFGRNIPFIIIALTGFASSVLSSFLPETLNAKLPQTVTDAEEFGKEEKYLSWRRKVKKKKKKNVEVSVISND